VDLDLKRHWHMRKLINGEVRSQSKRNFVQARAFSDRLQGAIARDRTNAITTVQVLEELIRLAKDIREAHQPGEVNGLSDEEIAFYDALVQNGSAREVMGVAYY
jgi:type I restriction enzyme R subunit